MPERGTALQGTTATAQGRGGVQRFGAQACECCPASIVRAVLEVEDVRGRPYVSALKDGIHFGIQRLFWGYRDTENTLKELVR